MVNRTRLFFIVALISLMLIGSAGCGTLGYYSQAAKGQLSILLKRKDIQTLINDPNSALTEQEIHQLKLILRVRKYAAEQLLMPVDKAYSRYVDTGKSHVVWNVFAAPELSLEPKRWCYPIAGCAAYRGYFVKQDAIDYAEGMKKKGFETFVGGVRAYSTLGWFEDPVLNTFLSQSDIQLAALLFHELAHRILYIPGDTEFNESFASAVSDFAVEQWLNTPSEGERKKQNRAKEDRNQISSDEQYKYHLLQREQLKQFYGIVEQHRIQLEAIYASEINTQEKRQAKEKLFQQLEETLSLFDDKIKKETARQSQFSRWAANANNAKLVTVNSYQQWVTAIRKELDRKQREACNESESNCMLGLTAFYNAMAKLKKLNKEQRTEVLKGWQEEG